MVIVGSTEAEGDPTVKFGAGTPVGKAGFAPRRGRVALVLDDFDVPHVAPYQELDDESHVRLLDLLGGIQARRTGETGIRMALGARPGIVIWMVLREVRVLAGPEGATGCSATLQRHCVRRSICEYPRVHRCL